MDCTLTSPGFRLALHVQFLPKDTAGPFNAIVTLSVESEGFAGRGDLDCMDGKQLLAFANELQALYATLTGTVRLEEPYGYRNYLEFSGDGHGHIKAEGRLRVYGHSGIIQELRFENQFDQSYLKPFSQALYKCCMEEMYGTEKA